VPGELGLHQNLARARSTTGAPRNLHDRLCKPFRGTEVSTEQTLVGVQNDDERDIGEIVSLGHHLRPDQDSPFTRGHAPHRFFHVAALSHDVTI
jgi:hypothetical protein